MCLWRLFKKLSCAQVADHKMQLSGTTLRYLASSRIKLERFSCFWAGFACTNKYEFRGQNSYFLTTWATYLTFSGANEPNDFLSNILFIFCVGWAHSTKKWARVALVPRLRETKKSMFCATLLTLLHRARFVVLLTVLLEEKARPYEMLSKSQNKGRT